MSNAETKSAVLVVGFHHCGTSMVAEMVSRLGFHLGDPKDMLGPNPHNPRGHFENLHALHFNEERLAQACASWYNPPPHSIAGGVPANVRTHTVLLISGGHARFAVKDPRLCLMIPLWLLMLELDLGFPVKVVQIMRNPYAAARSVSRFHKHVTMNHALSLWSLYMERAQREIHTLGIPVEVFNYEHILADPAGQAKRLASYLDSDAWEQAAQCVVPNLKGA